MNLTTLTDLLHTKPEQIEFADTIALIDKLYRFTPTRFQNGALQNEANQNNGSCKLFAFAKLHGLSEQQTLACFGHYYRNDVLQNPQGTDHQNIRNFIQTGWQGIRFDAMPLTPTTSESTTMSKFENVTVTKKANVYFEGKVTSRSIAFANGETKTLGIMLPGEYTFNTGKPEVMEIMSGDVEVLLPGETKWRTIKGGESFDVKGNAAFQIKVKDITDYCCSFIG